MTATIQHGALSIQCPPWCTSQHIPNNVSTAWGDGDAFVLTVEHEGPTFGAFSCGATENLTSGALLPDVTVEVVEVPDIFEDGADLRRHIADAQAALAWMESVK